MLPLSGGVHTTPTPVLDNRRSKLADAWPWRKTLNPTDYQLFSHKRIPASGGVPGESVLLPLSPYYLGFRYTFSSAELAVSLELPFLVIDGHFFAIG